MSKSRKGPTPKKRVVHALPPEGAAFTPCCNRTLFELPRAEKVTADDRLVNCKTREPHVDRDPAELDQQIQERIAAETTPATD